MLKEQMTPDELAALTGFSRQTINKWVRTQGWSTSQKPGIQGGKARLIHIDKRVEAFIHRVSRPFRASDAVGDTSFEQLLADAVREMTHEERAFFTSLLLREGIRGVLRRLTACE